MSLQASDAEAGALAVAPRVTLADIEAAIRVRHHVNAAEATGGAIRELGHVSLRVLVMKNGFVIVGKSAPASPENFNAEFGRKLAYEDCIRQLWPLMGFTLRDKLHATKEVP